MWASQSNRFAEWQLGAVLRKTEPYECPDYGLTRFARVRRSFHSIARKAKQRNACLRSTRTSAPCSATSARNSEGLLGVSIKLEILAQSPTILLTV
jgi:hypothetical protein